MASHFPTKNNQGLVFPIESTIATKALSYPSLLSLLSISIKIPESFSNTEPQSLCQRPHRFLLFLELPYSHTTFWSTFPNKASPILLISKNYHRLYFLDSCISLSQNYSSVPPYMISISIQYRQLESRAFKRLLSDLPNCTFQILT